jgi:hypothetical protein
MEDLEIFDKRGKVLHIADVMRSFLKENLDIQISTSKERDYGDEYTVIEVSISLDGEEICKSSDIVR